VQKPTQQLSVFQQQSTASPHDTPIPDIQIGLTFFRLTAALTTLSVIRRTQQQP
jgi:hypothetical protein